MIHADLNNPEEVDALVELWMGTPEGASLWPLMWKWAKNDDWRRGADWFKDMKKNYVQLMQWHLHLTISEDEESCSVSDVLQ